MVLSFLKTKCYSLEVLEVAFRSCYSMLATFFFYNGHNLLEGSRSVERLNI